MISKIIFKKLIIIQKNKKLNNNTKIQKMERKIKIFGKAH